MMSFCKRSFHSFLGGSTTTTTNSNDNGSLLKPTSPQLPRGRNIPSPIDGLSLIAVTCNTLKPPSNVLESTIIKSSCSSPLTVATTTTAAAGSGLQVFGDLGVVSAKKVPSEIGFIDDIGGGVDGLMSCTESLGFESSDERRTDEQLDDVLLLEMNDERETEEELLCSSSTTSRNQWRKRIKVRSDLKKSFPPPLSSLNQNGQPSFYLRPVRKDGRLELTEVRIDRKEVLHASRHDGRLRLHLIRDEIEEDDEEEEEIDEKIQEENVEEERESADEWKLPAMTNTGGGDGFRRCYELVNHRHHNYHPSNLHVWSQHCVTTG